MMLQYDVPVALIFFNRPDTLKSVFEAIRKRQPKQLFLIQDGARQGVAGEKEKVMECRKVVENIDWECNVVRDYSEENLGCGMRIYTGISNAFEAVDRLIIIEDDIVVSDDFFVFCRELLEKYKDDDRIQRISGMCHMGRYDDSPYSYGFTNISACWGWATWKRVWKEMDYNMSFLSDDYTMRCFRRNYRYKKDAREWTKIGKQRKAILDNGGKLSAWTYQFEMGGKINNRLDITPCVNLISCIGLTADSVHASNKIKKIPKGLQQAFFGKTYPLELPIKHPKYIMEDVDMENKMRKVLGWTPWLKFTRKIEGIVRQIIFADKGDLPNLWNKLMKCMRSK